MGERWTVGLDLGGTKLATALFKDGTGGAPVFHSALPNKKYDTIFRSNADKLTPEEKSKQIEDAMVASVEELCSQAGVSPTAVGICTAGFIEGDMVVDAKNTGMKDYPLRTFVEKRLEVETFLFKDSWAPVFAVDADKPAIIFSIGTGFGGVSCDPGMAIKLRSYTARRRIIWIPFLYANDDPGYAVSFSIDRCESLFSRAFEKASGAGVKGSDDISPARVREMAVR
ncbi:MAG TPA: ROK family protein, partial [bacterium]|nr:ROK family protein [bacterium]